MRSIGPRDLDTVETATEEHQAELLEKYPGARAVGIGNAFDEEGRRLEDRFLVAVYVKKRRGHSRR